MAWNTDILVHRRGKGYDGRAGWSRVWSERKGVKHAMRVALELELPLGSGSDPYALCRGAWHRPASKAAVGQKQRIRGAYGATRQRVKDRTCRASGLIQVIWLMHRHIQWLVVAGQHD